MFFVTLALSAAVLVSACGGGLDIDEEEAQAACDEMCMPYEGLGNLDVGDDRVECTCLGGIIFYAITTMECGTFCGDIGMRRAEQYSTGRDHGMDGCRCWES